MTCRIAVTVGAAEPCPGPSCPFWEDTVRSHGCGLERLALDDADPQLASYLLELRHALEETRELRERDAARRAFAALVPPELAES